MRKLFEIGGLVAAVILIVFGAAAVYMGFDGRSTVQSTIKQEQIVGTPDMTPAAIAKEAKQAGLPASVSLPTCSVANQPVNDGASARCFAQYMRIHALEATGGQTYAQMPRYATADGQGTNDAAAAQKGPSGQPLDNPKREVWINETALSTALNTAYMADQISLFGIVVGIALLLSGIGFGILAIGGALRNPDTAVRSLRRHAQQDGLSATPTA
jgi:F0F1-type ATP synthase membrane subunit c/vacuolar-type H+-ATPase subunit K